jgi:heptosyltransferase-3
MNLSFLRNLTRTMIDSVILAESFFYFKKNSKHGTENKKRILIMRKDGLGDCIIFYPTLKAYRDFYANDDITLVFPNYFETLAPLLRNNLVNRVIWFDHKKFGSSFSYRRKFLLDLKRAGYDIVIYPVYTRETIGFFMMKMTGAKERIGFDGDISAHGLRSERMGTLKYTRLIKPPEDMKSEITRDVYFANVVTGKKMSLSFPTIDITTLPHEKADKIISENNLTERKFALIFPGAGASFRIWPIEKFAHAIDHIQSKGIAVIIAGSAKETELVKNIISRCSSKSNIIDISGKTDLSTLAHIIHKSIFYFGSDTGILHLAASLNTPTVAIMGMGGLDCFFPYGDLKKNRIIQDKTRTYVTGTWNDASSLKPGEIHPSIRNITVEDAKKEIDYIIQYAHDHR